MTDWQLLQQYVNEKSESAFTRIVEKHLKLVNGVCYREIGNEQVAEDAVQVVFLLLAQKAGSISKGASLAGWLFTASRLVSRNALRHEMRRKKVEAAAALQMEYFTPGGAWSQIDPHLNEALAALPDSDKQALLLRYFDGLSVREVANELGSTETAAKVRIWRSLQKMRRFLATKGVAVTAVLLSAELLAHPSKAASEACRQSALRTFHGLTREYLAANPQIEPMHKGVHAAMQAIRYKKVITAAAVLGVAAGIGLLIVLNLSSIRSAIANAMNGGQAMATSSTPSIPVSTTAISVNPATLAADRKTLAASMDIEEQYAAFGQNTAASLAGDHNQFKSWQVVVNTLPTGAGPTTLVLQHLQINTTIQDFQLNGHSASTVVNYSVVGTINSSGERVALTSVHKDVWHELMGHWRLSGTSTITGQTTMKNIAPDARVEHTSQISPSGEYGLAFPKGMQ
jgi:RNA polymerase sigma factor (sigma-70 family)